MSKTPKQKEKTAQVQARLIGEGSVRLDASAVTSGKSGGASGATTKTIHGIHPSLEGSVAELEAGGFKGGTITTPSGLSVQVVKGPRSKEYVPHGQGLAPQQGKTPLPPVQEGVSQRFETRIGHERGADKAAELTAEAESVAERPNPLRSDGLVDAAVFMHQPSMGGNRLGHGGTYSALAKMDDARLPQSKVKLDPSKRKTNPNFPSLANGPAFQGPRDLALHSIGYGDEVQTQMLGAARDRIARRQGKGQSPALSHPEIMRQAYAQVNEHLDEALHGTKQTSLDPTSTRNVISDLAAQQENETHGFAVMRDSPKEGAGQVPQRGKAPRGPGMTKSRTPQQVAQKRAVRGLVRQSGGWGALREGHLEAAANDLKVLSLQQKARTAMETAPEERITGTQGSNPEQKGRANAQPVFTTGGHESLANPGVGVLRVGPGAQVQPPRARPGAISPVPPNLPMEPARLGRTREERGVGPRDYTPDIKAYAEGRVKQPILKATSKGRPTGVPTAKKQPAKKQRRSNTTVAQTAQI